MSMEQDNGTRLTNSEILRELRHESSEHGQALAVLQTQTGTIQSLFERFTQQYETLVQRVVAGESAAVDLRARLVTLESRTPAMTSDERTALKAQVTSNERRIATNETAIHEIQLRDLSGDDKDDIRRYLEIARRRGVDDAFTPDETDAIRARIKADQRHGKWQDDLQLGTILQVMLMLGTIIAFAIAHFAGW